MQPVPVTVLMCAYNVEAYISESIQSVLDQTFRNFEFLIFDDCSTDSTVSLIESFSDDRIKLIRNAENMGLTRSLIEGISKAKGKYIARMDADDISYPDRLLRQFHYMEEHPEVGLCGCWYQSFGAKDTVVKYELDHEQIGLKLLYQTQFCHAAVFIRKSVLIENEITYDPSFITAQDYDLWTRLLPLCKLANIPEVLFAVRYHEKSISVVKKTQQWDNHYRIMHNQFKRIGIDAATEEISQFIRLCNGDFDFDKLELTSIGYFLAKLIKSNSDKAYFKVEPFNSFLRDKWFHLCYNTVKVGSYQLYREIPALQSTSLLSKNGMKFYLKAWVA